MVFRTVTDNFLIVYQYYFRVHIYNHSYSKFVLIIVEMLLYMIYTMLSQ